ncbi:MAG: type I-B CRISPR-associated protein Cas5 [Spirochaetes bacterium]|nr:MAG: type I-B CRISPR-associated protein Cas5 [Spirochaetota bacterium]
MSNTNLNPDRVLIFDLKGPMAHFRKYYTNSSSLSYLFPPRTVIIGLIAGLLGFPSERHTNDYNDSYYEKFNKARCFTTVSLRTKIRRIMQTVNYIKTKTDNQSKYSFEALITGTRGAPTQIPLEILLPEKTDEISYRVYFYHVDGGIYSKLKERLEEHRFVFPPYLGITEFLASIDYIDEGRLQKNSVNKIEVNSVCNLEDIKEIDINSNGNELQYITEKMPIDFLNDRTPKKFNKYLAEINCRKMRLIVKDNAVPYLVKYSENGCRLSENIMFM